MPSATVALCLSQSSHLLCPVPVGVALSMHVDVVVKWQSTVEGGLMVVDFRKQVYCPFYSSILRSDPMVALDGLQGRYRLAPKGAKSLPDS